jgi:hypothetical protein
MDADQEFEANYWGDCCCTIEEEIKQQVYAPLMGLQLCGYRLQDHRRKAQDKAPLRVIDIGGGPVSLLLKANFPVTGSLVVDPLPYPDWTAARYASKGISVYRMEGEAIVGLGWELSQFDEAWIYNCLQHVRDPALIIRNALSVAPVLRLFEWIDIPAHPGHPQCLTREALDKWTGSRGFVCRLDERGCHGTGYGVVAHAVPALTR